MRYQCLIDANDQSINASQLLFGILKLSNFYLELVVTKAILASG